MGMHAEKVSLNEAHQKVEEYTYALLFMISERILCRTKDLPAIDWEECQEARFFSEDKNCTFLREKKGCRQLKSLIRAKKIL